MAGGYEFLFNGTLTGELGGLVGGYVFRFDETLAGGYVYNPFDGTLEKLKATDGETSLSGGVMEEATENPTAGAVAVGGESVKAVYNLEGETVANPGETAGAQAVAIAVEKIAGAEG